MAGNSATRKEPASENGMKVCDIRNIDQVIKELDLENDPDVESDVRAWADTIRRKSARAS